MHFFIFLAIPLVIWIYLVIMVWKKNTNIFPGQMESKLAERSLKMLKAFLLLSGLSLATYFGFILHIVLFRSPDYEGGFFMLSLLLYYFLLDLLAAWLYFLRDEEKQHKGIDSSSINKLGCEIPA